MREIQFVCKFFTSGGLFLLTSQSIALSPCSSPERDWKLVTEHGRKCFDFFYHQ